ncbi:MAG: bifunctional phosphopantothenoylcysteine decarboxylase/phosphopantothenate--cysteine ligase CoaBC [Pseudomonadota bacterium]|jgi:phosphopantothenoylcysteine decarboxylase/phosphopantothenate--cysteine ligase
MANSRLKKRLVLGVTGSIACYKAAELARYFMRRGYSVRVVMTESATKFVAPLTFQALTGNPVAESFWSEGQPGTIGHIELADWADVVVVAPATADCIAKLAHGFAGSSLLAVVLATKAPVVVAPAMNVNMFENPQTQANLLLLEKRGMTIVAPESGALACGWTGSGRLASAAQVFAATERVLGPGDLNGRRVVISAGPTREPIDPVRYLSNRSSGKMGIALAREAYRRGAQVVLVHGPLGYTPVLPSEIIRRPVVTAEQMHKAILAEVYGPDGSIGADIAVMAAAVADFRPDAPAELKIKRAAGTPSVALEANPDILAELGKRRVASSRPCLVGFAVETADQDTLIAEARAKLERKGADFIVANQADVAFEGDNNRVWIIKSCGEVVPVPMASKRRVAREIWREIASSLSSVKE